MAATRPSLLNVRPGAPAVALLDAPQRCQSRRTNTGPLALLMNATRILE
jgi:hypothetical protein